MELVNRTKAVSKLVRKPLFRMFLEKATDKLHAKKLACTRRPEARRNILRQYLHAPDAYANKSQFLVTEVDSVLAALPTNTHRKRTVDPLKLMIAKIKGQHPKISHVKLCSRLDEMDSPVPSQWSTQPNCTWTFAFKDRKKRSRMKVYFSKIPPILDIGPS